jgi:hypothetical protein
MRTFLFLSEYGIFVSFVAAGRSDSGGEGKASDVFAGGMVRVCCCLELNVGRWG